ncbi:hypothetical protein PybrP1_001540 [[Pythium] brassicae (nom. inval.)]|nr:hypothetical protein PybrP1_001540 [[Pythium] brassicae (nom. inval.)]
MSTDADGSTTELLGFDTDAFEENACVGSSDSNAGEEQSSTVGDHGNSTSDGGDSEEDDDALGSWQQLVFQRPGEAMTHLEVFASGGAGFEHLLVLNLQQNALHDISPLLSAASTLRVLNISQNQIATLPSAQFWGRFGHLTMCFLAHNRIQHWRDADGLQACSATLLWLTLHGNPIAALANARPFLVNKLPFLRALDDFVVTDCELMKTHGTSTRFRAVSPHMDLSSLHMPLEFVDDNFALAYLRDTEARVLRIHASNSPVVVAQRVVRGFLSRRRKLPRVARISELIVRVQKCARGFLLRRRLERAFLELVRAHGQEHLLTVTSTDSPLLPTRARDGLKKLVVHVQEWKRRFHLKKQAIAVKKIRFWCQMAYQRYASKARRLLADEQAVFIYYTAPFESELLAIAAKAARRDPFLMAMAPADREHLRSAATDPGPLSAVVRVFSRDRSLENSLLITEKQFLQRDLERIAQLKRAHQLALSISELPASGDAKQQPRAVLVHLTQLSLELEKRLVICNRKLLRACVKQQQRQASTPARFTLARVGIRPRGHSPARWERSKATQLAARDCGRPPPYVRMHVLIPWSIDMHLQIVAALDRTLAGSCGPAFALSYAQARAMSAALSIQCVWRARQHQARRHALEVTVVRALRCIQRWWRCRVGLRQRLDFVRAALRLCATVTSRTLFMEEGVFRAVSDAAAWAAVRSAMRPCKEHSLRSHMVAGSVEVVLSPSALLLRKHAQQRARGLELSSGGGAPGSSVRAAGGVQRCGAYLPVWLPGTPEHTEVSMTSRDEDATPQLLTERVLVEPTLLEREFMLGRTQPAGPPRSPGSTSTAASHLLQSFALCRRVAETSARVAELSRRLSSRTKQLWLAQPPVLALDATSFVRLTFESVDEARKRALVLLSKTFDPVTRTYARLYSVEALVGAALRHHQWALDQVATPDESAQVLLECAQWLDASFPSPWWAFVRDRLDVSALSAAPLPSPSLVPTAPARSDSAPHFRRHLVHDARAASSPSPPMSPRPPPPVHVTVPGVSTEGDAFVATPPSVAAAPDASSRPTMAGDAEGSSRHRMLADRVGKPRYVTLAVRREEQLEDREYRVRDLREERERAMEALIVDRRMLQREYAAELAGIQLETDVKLQKLRYAREAAKLHVRELIEAEKLAARRSQLTRRFEKAFAAQTGAMMRLAARDAVAHSQQQREDARSALAARVRRSSAEALERRQDAKSYWFVGNQRAKASVARQHVADAEHADEAAHARRMTIRKRISEDKEIKAMLRLV